MPASDGTKAGPGPGAGSGLMRSRLSPARAAPGANGSADGAGDGSAGGGVTPVALRKSDTFCCTPVKNVPIVLFSLAAARSACGMEMGATGAATGAATGVAMGAAAPVEAPFVWAAMPSMSPPCGPRVHSVDMIFKTPVSFPGRPRLDCGPASGLRPRVSKSPRSLSPGAGQKSFGRPGRRTAEASFSSSGGVRRSGAPR